MMLVYVLFEKDNSDGTAVREIKRKLRLAKEGLWRSKGEAHVRALNPCWEQSRPS